jgi:ribosome maturation factor RimP
MSSSNKLNGLIQPLVEDLGYEFVGLVHNANPKHSVLRVYIDAEEGVGLKDCERVSREVAALLDVENPIRGHYNLEISSPGLDRPLFTGEHYRQFKGEQAQLSLFAPEHGRRKVKGEILGQDETHVKMLVDDAEFAFRFDNIAKARLVPDYELLMAERKKAQSET